MNTSMNTSEYRRAWAQACWRSWRAEREMLAELAQGEAAALTRLPLEDWLEAGATIDTLRENLTVGAWCLAVAEYAAWMPQH